MSVDGIYALNSKVTFNKLGRFIWMESSIPWFLPAQFLSLIQSKHLIIKFMIFSKYNSKNSNGCGWELPNGWVAVCLHMPKVFFSFSFKNQLFIIFQFLEQFIKKSCSSESLTAFICLNFFLNEVRKEEKEIKVQAKWLSEINFLKNLVPLEL